MYTYISFCMTPNNITEYFCIINLSMYNANKLILHALRFPLLSEPDTMSDIVQELLTYDAPLISGSYCMGFFSEDFLTYSYIDTV